MHGSRALDDVFCDVVVPAWSAQDSNAAGPPGMAAYEAVRVMAEANLKVHGSVVVDAVNDSEAARDCWRAAGRATATLAPGAARALAEDVDQAAPDGHDARSVVAHVLSEEWLYRSAFTHDREGAIAFVTSEDTKRWLRAAADRSVLSTSHQPSVETPAALNAFAFTAGLAGDNGLARELFGQLDGRATTWPWAILGDPAAVYADTRKGA